LNVTVKSCSPTKGELGAEVDRAVLVRREVEVVLRRPVADADRVRPGGNLAHRLAVGEGEADVEAVVRSDSGDQELTLGAAGAAGPEREDRGDGEDDDRERRRNTHDLTEDCGRGRIRSTF
jgi:hypothetical protein